MNTKKIILILATVLLLGTAAALLTACGCEEHSEAQKIEVEE